jgi:hypothetical protein
MGVKEEVTALYDRDFYEWTQRNSELLRRGCFAEADVAHIAEETEDMGKRDKRALASRLLRILEHKVKLEFVSGPDLDRNRRGWAQSIVHQQIRVRTLLKENPSFVPDVPSIVPEAYQDAIRVVSAAYSFEAPPQCPWSAEEILGG